MRQEAQQHGPHVHRNAEADRGSGKLQQIGDNGNEAELEQNQVGAAGLLCLAGVCVLRGRRLERAVFIRGAKRLRLFTQAQRGERVADDALQRHAHNGDDKRLLVAGGLCRGAHHGGGDGGAGKRRRGGYGVVPAEDGSADGEADGDDGHDAHQSD